MDDLRQARAPQRFTPEHFRWPNLTSQDVDEVARYLASHQPLTIDRPEGVVAELESSLRQAFSCQYALTFNSGTSALHAAYFALDLPRGSLVASPVFTFPATVMPMLDRGLLPLFCDADPETSNVPPEAIASAIGKGAAAVVVTHMWGHPCEIDRVLQMAREAGVPVIEDASHAPGAYWNGQPVGALGDVGVVSLHGFKLICAGEGGAFLTNRRDLYERAVVFGHNQQRIEDEVKDARLRPYAPYGYGLKLRIHPLGALLALQHVRKLRATAQQQRAVAALLDAEVSRSGTLSPPAVPRSGTRVYYNYKPVMNKVPVRRGQRERIVSRLQALGVAARVPDSGLLADHPIFRGPNLDLFGMGGAVPMGEFPGARKYFATSLTIPFPFTMPAELVSELGREIRNAADGV